MPGSEEGYVDGKLKVVHPKEGSLRIQNYEEVLQQGFAEGSDKSKDNKIGKWDIHATTWHLDVERWLLEDQAMLSKAIQAFTSHIRAYATHLSSEREFFNVKLLHLGHLAKSFGLRETPKKLGKSVGNNSNFTESKRGKKEDPKRKCYVWPRWLLKLQVVNLIIKYRLPKTVVFSKYITYSFPFVVITVNL